jgi:hypothetical protein
MTGRSSKKDVLAAAVLAFFAYRMLVDQRVPILTFVDMLTHEVGRIISYPMPPVVTAIAGSVVQVAVPLVLAIYMFNRDDAGAAVCLGWTATNLLDVARYMAQSPPQQLPLFGGGNTDWSFFFAQTHTTASAHDIEGAVRLVAWIVLGCGAVVLAYAYARETAADRTATASS